MDRSLKRFVTLIALLLSALLVRGDTTYYDAVVWDFGSSLLVKPGINVTFMPGSTVDATGATLVGFPGGTGSSSFLGLVDTPSSYVGQGGKVVAVKTDLTGLEFIVPAAGGGGGSVTSFSSGNLLPLFTTSVVNPTSVPALSFVLNPAASHTFYGNETGSSASPHFVQPNFTDFAGDFTLTQTPSLAASNLIGRGSASSGDWQAITVGSGLSLTGTTLTIGATVGNVLSTGAISTGQLPIWTDATHIKGVTSLAGGTAGQVLKKSTGVDYDWEWAPDISGSGGSSTFITLTDVPPSYTGAAGKFVAVNNTANGLEFVVAPSGGGGAVTSVFGRTGAVVAVSGDYGAFFQPLDSDLTSIASLTTTTFGRGFLTLADAAASRSYIGAGTSNFDGTWTALTGKPTTLVGFGITDAQPLDADLTALAAASGTNTLYYRSAANTWSAVTFGSNLTWGSGTLNAANTNWDTAYNERNQWNGGATGLVPATGRTSLGLDIGTNVQAFDADLASLAAASATNSLYYRSAANTWSPVTIGSNMTFSGGTLDSTSGGDVSGPSSSTDLGFALYSGTSGKLLRGVVSNGIVTSTAGVFGVITDNSVNWNNAWTQTREWDGGATGLVAATGRASLALSNVTNDVQAQAAIYPNTSGTAGQLLVGQAGVAYAPKTVSGGSGVTASLSATGVLSVSGIANANLANDDIQIGNAGSRTVLGGTVGLDSITGMSGVAGLVKRSAANTFSTAVAGTDYKAGSTDSISVKIITTTSTYTTPAGVSSLYVECVAGGGGGGGAKSTSGMIAGGGGGGGGYAAVLVTSPAASYTVTVGAGGTAGTAAGGNGGTGGTTSVGAVSVATGGTGGTGYSGAGGIGVWSSASTGGTGTTGTLKATGGDGGFGFTFGGNNQTSVISGAGGSSVFGGITQARGVNVGSATGTAGAAYGGGASGGAATASGQGAGGVGAAGVVRIWEIF